MSRVGNWFEQQLPHAEIACSLAGDRFWRDPQQRLIATHPDLSDAANLVLDLDEEVAHALVLVLSRLPQAGRRAFSGAFYEGRDRGHGQSRRRATSETLALGAGAAVLVVDLAADELRTATIVDLLEGAAQGDDLTLTPEPALAELRKAIARVRFNVDFDDPEDPRGAASLAIAEVLDPAGDTVALQEVVARAAWAAVESWEQPRVLAFLLALDRAFAESPA